MTRARIVFLGTPDIATPCLEKLARTADLEVVGVITQPDRPAGRKMNLQPSPVKLKATELGIPILTPESARAPEVLGWVRERRPDSAVVVAYGQILSKEFLSLFPKPAVNIHASLLPRWRGAAPIQRAIMAGDKETGVSLQVIVPKLDAGPLLGSRTLSIDDNLTAMELYARIQSLAPELLKEYGEYLRSNNRPIPQDEKLVTVAHKVAKEEGLINWSNSAKDINCQIRGLWIWPGSWTMREGKTLKIWTTRIHSGQEGRPGQVVEVGPESIKVATGSGILEVLEVQPESRARMAVREYLKGYPVEVGEIFG